MIYDVTQGKCEAEVKERCRYHGTKMGDFLPPHAETLAKVSDLQARLWTATGAQRRELQAQLDAAALDLDATDEGMAELLATNEHDVNDDSIFRFYGEERISNARVHQVEARTAVAIADYKAARNHNVLRLFDGTNTTPYETEDGLVGIADPTDPNRRHVFFDPRDEQFDTNVVRFRQHVADGLANGYRYNRTALLDDLNGSSLVMHNVPGQKDVYLVTDVEGSKEGAVIAEITLNKHGVFEQARVGTTYADNSVQSVTAVAQARSILARAKKTHDAPEVPAWVTGRVQDWQTTPARNLDLLSPISDGLF